MSTLVIGARNEEQLKANLGAVGWKLTAEQVAKLDAASEVPLAYPYWHQRQFEERNPAGGLRGFSRARLIVASSFAFWL